jgi:hypothetical protein
MTSKRSEGQVDIILTRKKTPLLPTGIGSEIAKPYQTALLYRCELPHKTESDEIGNSVVPLVKSLLWVSTPLVRKIPLAVTV